MFINCGLFKVSFGLPEDWYSVWCMLYGVWCRKPNTKQSIMNAVKNDKLGSNWVKETAVTP